MTMPDHLAQVHEADECESADEASARERWVEERVLRYLSDGAWWDDKLKEVNPITAELSYVLAASAGCEMAITPGDTRGTEILNAGIAWRVGRFVRTIARDEARKQAEQEYSTDLYPNNIGRL